MQFKALSPLFVLSCVSGLAAAVGCSDPPEATPPPPSTGVSGSNSTAGTNPGASGAGTTGGTPGAAGSTPGTAGTGGTTPTTGGTPGTAGSGGTPGTAGSGGTPGTAGSGGSGTGGGGTGAPVIPGYTLVIDEGFDAAINLDTDPIWTWSDGALDEGQVRYTKEAITFADGKMKITASKPAGGVPGSMSFAENKNVGTYPIQSGEFRTKFNNYRYGRYEARIKAPMPAGANAAGGNFINTLFTFRTPKVEDWREIDIEITAGGSNMLMTNLVYANNNTSGAYGATQNKAIQTTNGLPVPPGFNSMSDFHTYTFVWEATKVTWFLDGTQIRQETGQGSPPIPEKSAKIMMSLWIFADNYGFGGPDGELNMFPFTAEYDWFRFYKQDAEMYPVANPATTLPAEDLNKSKNNATETDTQG